MSAPAKSPHAPSNDGVFRRGFGLKSSIEGELASDYDSELIARIRANGNRIEVGGLEIRLAKEFGFCYGVDKAVDFAYETRRNFPDRRIFLTAEIIHNPRVNNRLIEMGIQFLGGQYACGLSAADLRPEDVVLLPAFGVGNEELETYRQRGCVIVDTTCGSVVHVWKRVEKYAREGFTSLIHGKYKHEETVATASHAYSGGEGKYIVVLDKTEAGWVCDSIRHGGDAAGMARRFEGRVSGGFDFARDLERIGVANQTTMLSSESLEIAGMIRQALIARYGAATIEDHFRSFDTICSATQERQDAVMEMMKSPPDLMLVIGGYNSSNTHHLCEIASKFCPTYHIDEPDCLISSEVIRHKPLELAAPPEEARNWLPPRRPLSIGLTAGASTPNRVIAEVIERLRTFD
ncbi:4-hydroxy-3-methylbut-2-enyl diphosphate reductase [Candidatus Sumerlaeota bacterium]|nr:4-hydroxy-3-methylbut-2-enyl diphosphate reductase [Candidatus Sumerlaeota bacterium]